MRHTIGKNINISGFSLIELAIVIVIGGLLLVPSLSLYHSYVEEKDWEETEDNLSGVINEIGGFRSVYGRYPCPASPTADPAVSTDRYGLEEVDCNTIAVTTCSNGVCAHTSEIAGEVVIVGSLPFKSMNLDETETFDSSLNRYTYAVTAKMTVGNLFDFSSGAIGIKDKTLSLSMVNPENTAQFVVVSHGRNKAGGYTRSGNVANACTNGSAIEKKNCDGYDPTAVEGHIFVSGEIDNDFDDRLAFFSGILPTEWKITTDDSSEIHLKNTNGFAVGANSATDLSVAPTGSVLDAALNKGTIQASESFYSVSLCEDEDIVDDADCFAPRLIAGSLDMDVGAGDIRFQHETSGGSGISCYKPSADPSEDDGYLVGIQEGREVCSEEIFLSCPIDTFINEVTATGEVKCSLPPGERCLTDQVDTTCGDTRTRNEIASGQYLYLYSGDCRMLDDMSEDDFDAYFAANIDGLADELKAAAMNTFVDNLNAVDRSMVDCGENYNFSQVRDRYKCLEGEWSVYDTRHRRYPFSNYMAPGVNNSTPEMADLDNDEYGHDCWCREDYKVYTGNIVCGTHMGGTKVRIDKHNCPQAGTHYWEMEYQNASGCICELSQEEETLSCAAYYDEVAGNALGTTNSSLLNGTVKKTYPVTCSDNDPVIGTIPIEVDVSECACPSNSQGVSKTMCSAIALNTTNDWSWVNSDGFTQFETGVAALSTLDWTCPEGGLLDDFGSTVPHPGSYGELTPVTDTTPDPIPDCGCVGGITQNVVATCPDGMQTDSAPYYVKEWDCLLNGGLGAWEPEEDWEFFNGVCKSCAVQEPAGGGFDSELIKVGGNLAEIGSLCSCGSVPLPNCWNYNGNPIRGFTSCQCVAQD